MIVLTITSEGWESMTQECLRRASLHLGLHNHHVIKSLSKEESHMLKIKSLLQFHEPVTFIDSDWMAIRDAHFPLIYGKHIISIPTFDVDAIYKGTAVPRRASFCSGLISLDMGDNVVREAVTEAYEAQSRAILKEAIIDEYYLNVSIYARKELTVSLLSTMWNWCAPNPPDHVVGLHAAGLADKKGFFRKEGINV
jgi:hypothetical protein